MDLERYGIHVRQIIRNPSPALLYESALRHERGTAIAASGALVAMSGARTGRSPTDKRIVGEPGTRDEVWWGEVNIELDEHTFEINRERAIDYLNTLELLYVIDGYAGWSAAHRVKVRVICARAYHALFMSNMLVRPSASQLRHFGKPNLLIINAGAFPANRYTTGMTSTTSIDLHLTRRELVILGTEYAGEMKKGLFTVMNYLMPKAGVLPMHCSATAADGDGGDSAILFGLSGTGKTTLSHDPGRRLIGDDEHCWDDHGIFNIEGGCYAKVVDLAEAEEPDIYRALRFGAVLENVVYDARSREVAYADTSLTENTRGCYPIEFVPQAGDPLRRHSPATRDLPGLRCVRRAAAGGAPDAGAGGVPLRQRVQRQDGGHRGGRHRTGGDVFTLFRRPVPGVAPHGIQRPAGRAAAPPRQSDLAAQYRLERRPRRQQRTHPAALHARDPGRHLRRHAGRRAGRHRSGVRLGRAGRVSGGAAGDPHAAHRMAVAASLRAAAGRARCAVSGQLPPLRNSRLGRGARRRTRRRGQTVTVNTDESNVPRGGG